VATLTAGRTLPWSWYTDPALLERERERIFGRFWQYAAHTGQLAGPASYAATRVGSIPVVLVRDRDATLRGFVNVCRHRGSIICHGQGTRETLQCPYHAWTYNLDGSLRGAPRSDREPGFDPGALGLLPVQVDTWGPFVFVNPDPAAPALREYLGELPDLIASAGVDVDALVFHRRSEAEYDANWKVCSENYLECYHCSVAHPSFSRAIEVAPDAYELATRRWFSSQFGEARNGGGGVYDAAGEVTSGQFHLLFPNTPINVMPGRANLSIGPVIPLTAERTYRFLDYFFAPDTEDAWVADYLALDEQVGREDRSLVEGVQAGARAGVVYDGVLMPESERLIAHFQALVAEALGEG
jgi:phenylpropionate dioxygenase-like ring-hydroxylating dioxygenase large terminal subunit